MVPLSLKEWSKALFDHPDQRFVSYLLSSIPWGFRIGFNRHCPLDSASSNMVSTHPEIVQEYLSREVALGRMFTKTHCRNSHISPLGIISKKNKPGKWRLIVDMSSPFGQASTTVLIPHLHSTLSIGG